VPTFPEGCLLVKLEVHENSKMPANRDLEFSGVEPKAEQSTARPWAGTSLRPFECSTPLVCIGLQAESGFFEIKQ
jgi:hypothetical protein